MPGDAAFPRSARITRAAEYGQAFASGSRLTAARLSIRIRLRSEADSSARLGMAISKRNARTAVLRNRIKRVLRDRFRHLRSDLPSVDVVVQLRGPISAHQTDDLGAELTELIARGCRRLSLPFPAPALAQASVERSSKDAH